MNLEQIDTSTTAGKIRVMEMAEQGRRVVARAHQSSQGWQDAPAPAWDWYAGEYAIIAEPVGPDEVWHVVHADCGTSSFDSQGDAEQWASKYGTAVVRYVRAD